MSTHHCAGGCGRSGRFNKAGLRKGFCTSCAKKQGVWRPWDHDVEPEGFEEFWTLVTRDLLVNA